MVEVSVIVPIYNSGKYLRKCLLSLAGQTFSKMEVILIDDGSTDLSRYICETFLQRIFLLFIITGKKTADHQMREIWGSKSHRGNICLL